MVPVQLGRYCCCKFWGQKRDKVFRQEMKMWHMHDHTTPEQAEINRGRNNNGKISQVEDTTPLDDDWDVNIRLAGSGVVHGIARPYCSTGGSS